MKGETFIVGQLYMYFTFLLHSLFIHYLSPSHFGIIIFFLYFQLKGFIVVVLSSTITHSSIQTLAAPPPPFPTATPLRQHNNKLMPRRCTIPLWLVFSLQSLIVAGAFIAVILVLVLQQRSQFKKAVFDKIDLQLHLAEVALVGPLITREKSFQQLVDRLEADPSLNLRMQAHNDLSSPNIQLFLNLTAFNIFSDPLAYTLYQHRMHPTKRMPPNISVNGPLWFGITSFASENLAGISNYDGTATVAPNPLTPLLSFSLL
jgi:hypothetical protein